MPDKESKSSTASIFTSELEAKRKEIEEAFLRSLEEQKAREEKEKPLVALDSPNFDPQTGLLSETNTVSTGTEVQASSKNREFFEEDDSDHSKAVEGPDVDIQVAEVERHGNEDENTASEDDPYANFLKRKLKNKRKDKNKTKMTKKTIAATLVPVKNLLLIKNLHPLDLAH